MHTIFSKGLIIYTIFLAIVVGTFLYLQLNGIAIYNSTETEHEGQEHTYGSGHSSHHSHGHYYHK